jgi:hypothetical protein
MTKRNVRVNRVILAMLVGCLLYIFYLQSRPCSCAGVDTIRTAVFHQGGELSISKPTLVQETAPPVGLVYASIMITDGPDSGRVDSAKAMAVVTDCMTERIYADTLRDDTLEMSYHAYVSNNRLDSLVTQYRILVPLVTYNVKPKVQVFLAGNVGTNGKGFIAGPEVIVKDKRDFLYGAGVDFNTTGDIYYRAKFGVKLSFRKAPLLR